MLQRLLRQVILRLLDFFCAVAKLIQRGKLLDGTLVFPVQQRFIRAGIEGFLKLLGAVLKISQAEENVHRLIIATFAERL